MRKRWKFKKKAFKAKVSLKRDISDFDNYDNHYDNFFSPKTTKSNKIGRFKKDDFFNNDEPYKEEIFPKKKKGNFYSDASSSQFINPLKYLKRSFQKKQEEKFDYDSDDNSNSKSDFDEFEGFNNNSIKLIDQINYNNITENENFIKENNQRTRNSGAIKESTESLQEDKKLGIRQK